MPNVPSKQRTERVCSAVFLYSRAFSQRKTTRSSSISSLTSSPGTLTPSCGNTPITPFDPFARKPKSLGANSVSSSTRPAHPTIPSHFQTRRLHGLAVVLQRRRKVTPPPRRNPVVTRARNDSTWQHTKSTPLVITSTTSCGLVRPTVSQHNTFVIF